MTTPQQAIPTRARIAWALFDWANQPFFTVVTTFIFGQYFANVMVGDPVTGQAEWAFTQSTSGVIIALLLNLLHLLALQLHLQLRAEGDIAVHALWRLAVMLQQPLEGGHQQLLVVAQAEVHVSLPTRACRAR